jgi:hypothetical protein
VEKPQTSGGELVLPKKDPSVQAIKLFYGDRNEQRPSPGDVMGLACLQLEPTLAAQSIHTRVDLAGEDAAASAQVPRSFTERVGLQRDKPGHGAVQQEVFHARVIG